MTEEMGACDDPALNSNTLFLELDVKLLRFTICRT